MGDYKVKLAATLTWQCGNGINTVAYAVAHAYVCSARLYENELLHIIRLGYKVRMFTFLVSYFILVVSISE